MDTLFLTHADGLYEYYYTYDAVGNIIEIEVYLGNTLKEHYTYEYDSLGQLVRENNYVAANTSGNTTITYEYDNSGNRISKKMYAYNEGSLSGMMYSRTTWSYVQDTTSLDKWNDVMVSFNGNTVITDAIGNTLSDGRYTYEWQNGRQLRKITLDEDSVVTFTYNTDGIRTGKYYGETSAAGGWEYTLDGSRVIRQVLRQADGSITMEYRFFYDANGAPKSFRIRNFNTDGSVYKDITCHYATNLQGDIVALYNDAGERMAEYNYDAWGKLLSRRTYRTEHTSMVENNWVVQMNPLRYRGYYWDSETGFYYLQSRYYDPVTGRFLNADGYVNANGDLLGFNMYAYCSNNPVMYTDPTGKTFVHCMTYKSGGTVPWSEPDRPLRDLLEKILNQSDSVALYDSDRFEDRHPFHGEILRLGYSTPSINFLNGDLGLGSLSVDFAPAGWEWDHLDLSLLDLGYAEVSAQIKDWTLECGAFASIWSPSVAIKIGRVQLEIGAEVGAIGAQVIVGKKGVSLKGAYEIGASLNISW